MDKREKSCLRTFVITLLLILILASIPYTPSILPYILVVLIFCALILSLLDTETIEEKQTLKIKHISLISETYGKMYRYFGTISTVDYYLVFYPQGDMIESIKIPTSQTDIHILPEGEDSYLSIHQKCMYGYCPCWTDNPTDDPTPSYQIEGYHLYLREGTLSNISSPT